MNRWIAISAAAAVALAVALVLIIGPPTGGIEQVRQVMLSYGPWAVAISICLMVAQAIISPLPANVITITNALVFGPFWGSLLSWFSMLLGSALCFILSRTLGKKFAVRIVGKSLETAEQFFKKYGLQSVFIVRIMPFVPFDAVSYGAGLVGVPFSKFILATAIGIIPSVLIYSYIGTMVIGSYWWVLGGVATVSGLVLLFGRKYLKKLIAMPVTATGS